MTPGERDDLVETVLKGSALHPPAHGTDEDCLDAESAAAWLDGGLAGAGLAAAQTHVAGCARCQELLRVLMESDDANASASVPSPAVVQRPDFGRRDATPPAARRTWLTWGTPIGAAIAAILALAVWLRVPSPDSAPPSAPAGSMASTESARIDEQPRPVPAPDVLSRAPQPPATASAEPAPPAAAKAVAPVAPPVSTPIQPGNENRFVGGVSGGLVGGIAGSGETAAAPPPPPPPPPVPAAAAASAAAAPPAAAPAASLRERAALAADATARVVPDVRAQTGAERWRVRGARIERSGDDGQTWRLIAAADGPALTAASAPAAGICWFVGRGGIVLVFDDATGMQRASVPDGADLVSVTARTEREAVVVTAAGRRLRTVDAGRTWTTER